MVAEVQIAIIAKQQPVPWFPVRRPLCRDDIHGHIYPGSLSDDVGSLLILIVAYVPINMLKDVVLTDCYV